MKRFGLNILGGLLAILGLLVSCEEEQLFHLQGKYKEVVLPIQYNLSTNTVTRAIGTSFEKSCIYQFNADGALVKKLDLAATDRQIAIYLPYATDEKLLCVFIANAAIADVESEGEVTTLTSLLERKYIITTTYNPGGDDRLLMSGTLEVTNTTSTLGFTLRPNVAKLNLTIQGFNTDKYNKIMSIQLRHVHNKIHFAHHAFTDDQKREIHAKFAQINSQPVEGYREDLVTYLPQELSASQTYPVTFSWYIPHNMLGEKKPYIDDNQHTLFVLSVEEKADWKTIKIPVYLAQRTDKNNDGKIYEDEVSTYNVEAGNVYNVSINLQEFVEITEENKTVNLEKYVEFPANTNCHLINPATTGIGTVYSIPVSRAWQYWGSRLPENTKWQAEVIWQDIPEQVLTFCDPDGNSPANTYTGQGKDPADPVRSRFFLKMTKGSHGNAVIGVKALDGPCKGQYIWSWHLWITDYNPNVAPVPSATYPNHVFNVTGGEVHRYKDPFDASGKNIKQIFWSDSAHSELYIMDRNLGAYSAKPSDNTADNVFRNAGMYYQYGRKDPFPASHRDQEMTVPTPLYDITGQRRLNNNGQRTHFTFEGGYTDCINHGVNSVAATEAAKVGVTATQWLLDWSIHYPDRFIRTDISNWGDWLPQDNPYYVSNWNHNNTTERDMEAKSLFDPCPLGWRVHRMGAMMIFSNDFRDASVLGRIHVTGNFTINGIRVDDRYYFYQTRNDNDNNSTTMLNTNLNIAREEFIGTGDSKIFNGYTFYIADYGKGPTAYYPRTNHRHLQQGFLVKTEDVCNWSIDGGLGDSDPKHVDYIHYGYHLDFYSTKRGGYMDMPDSAGKAYGLAVRCVKETVIHYQ